MRKTAPHFTAGINKKFNWRENHMSGNLSIPTNSCNLSKKGCHFLVPSKQMEEVSNPLFWGGNLFGIKIHLITCPSCISENTMETQPFEDVFPIESGGFSNVMLVFRGVSQFVFQSTPDRFQHAEIWCRAKQKPIQPTIKTRKTHLFRWYDKAPPSLFPNYCFFFSLKIRPISTGIFGRELPAMSQRPLQGEEAHPMFGFASRWSQNPYKCPLKGNKALLFWGEPGIGGVGPPRFSRKRRVAYCLVGCLHFRWLPLEFIGWSPESGCTRPSYLFRIIQSSR